MADPLEPEDGRSAELYRTLPLGAEDGSIRIFELLPSSDKRRDACVHITLRVVRLDTNPYYEALSYTWGASKLGRSICVNNEFQLAVTDNLFDALVRLRRDSAPRILWVDRICIFQDDTEERSEQVAQMGVIYENATLVNVWLGETGNAFSRPNLRFPLTAFAYFWRCLLNLEGLDLYSSAQKRADVRRAYRDALRGFNRAIKGALIHTLPNWHSRVWIFQEFVLAQRIYLCCGSMRTRFTSTWLHAFTWMTSEAEFGSFRKPTRAFYTRIKEMEYFRALKHKAKHNAHVEERPRWLGHLEHRSLDELYDVLVLSARSDVEATDLRDHLYSKMGLVKQTEARMIGCNYSLHVPMIYAQATVASIVTRQNFDIFDLVIDKSDAEEIASWAINFSKLKDFHIQGPWYRSYHRNSHSETCVFDALLASPSPKIGYDSGNSLLSISGYHLDSIVDTLLVDSPKSRHWPSESTLARFVHKTINSSSYTAGNRNLATLMEKFYMVPSARSSASNVGLPNRYRISWLDRVGFDCEIQEAFKLWTYLIAHENGANSETMAAMLEQATTSVGNGDMINLGYQVSGYLQNGGLRFFATSLGAVGFGPSSIAVGDSIALIRSHSPFVALRPVEEKHTFQGQVHIHCPLDESFLLKWATLGIKEDTFVLR